jgi:hypothetical protein
VVQPTSAKHLAAMTQRAWTTELLRVL